MRLALPGLLCLAALLPAPLPAQQAVDPDAPRKRVLTPDDVRRWMAVGEAELSCPVDEFRELAGKVAAGSTDVRILRAYSRLEARLAPFRSDLPPAFLLRAAEQKRALAARMEDSIPSPGCWVPLGPRNIPGRMTALEFHPSDPDTVFVGAADGGLWKTADAGLTWTPMTDAQPVLAVGGLGVDPVDPDTIYIGTGEGNYAIDNLSGVGILKTTDGGASWTRYPVATLTRTYFHQVVVDPDDRSSVWGATTAGLFHSTDSGQTWASAGNGLPAEDATHIQLSVKPASNVILVAIGANSANSGVWRSGDGGASWTLLPSIPSGAANGRIVLAQSRSNPDRLYAAVADRASSRTRGMYRSDDEGATWSATAVAGGGNGFCAQQCWYDMALAVDAGDPDRVYAAGLDNWRSTNGGTSWSRVTSWTANPGAPNYAHADQHWAASPRPGEVWVANDGGVSRSRDGGSTWEFVGEALETAQYYHISTDPVDDGYAIAGSQDNGTQKFSGAFSWREVIGGDGFYTGISWGDPRTWWGTLYFVDIFRSRDRGNGFVNVGNGIDPADVHPFISRIFLDRAESRTIYACTQRLWKSTDEGDNFVDISAGNTFTGRYLTAVDNCPADGQTIYIGARDGRVWVTRDGGASWTDRSAGIPAGRFVTSVSVHPTDPLTAYLSLGGYQAAQHIYKTSDGGATWSDISGSLPDISFNHVLVLEDVPNTIVAAADIGVYWSPDAGATWSVLGSDLPNVAVDWLAYAPGLDLLRAGTHGRGAWQLVTPNTCALYPEFAGLAAVAVVDAGGSCRPELTWAPARSNCALAPGLSYNVYRSTDPLFTPGPASLLAAGVTGTSYRDLTALDNVPYFYAVKAEDGQSGFPGPANGGKEDKNGVVQLLELGDPFAAGTLSDDGGDSNAWFRSGWWSVSSLANSTPAGRWAYRTGAPLAAAYTADTCAALTTPDMLLGTGAALSYQASYNIEDEWDGVAVEISTDGGGSWSDLPPAGGYPRTLAQTQGNACGWPPSKQVFSGPPGNAGLSGFQAYTSDLSAFAGQTARLRWRFTSDAGAEFEGFVLDDIRIGPAAPAASACRGCVAGSPGVVGNSLRMGRASGGALTAYWTSWQTPGSWNLHVTGDPTAIPGLWSNMASSIQNAPAKAATIQAPAPAGFYQVYGADNCSRASVP